MPSLLLQVQSDPFTVPTVEAFQLQGKILGSIFLTLWGLELIDSLFLRGYLNRFGIYPRQARGLKGIFLYPLLHGDLKHLATNTMPLMILGWIILLSGIPAFALVTGVVWLVSGFGVWIFGAPRSNHIGASGIVFGYLGFLVARGYFDQSPGAIAIAIIVGLAYGSLIWGVLPFQRGKSWEGHLFGLIGGGLAAKYWPEIIDWFQFYLQQFGSQPPVS